MVPSEVLDHKACQIKIHSNITVFSHHLKHLLSNTDFMLFFYFYIKVTWIWKKKLLYFSFKKPNTLQTSFFKNVGESNTYWSCVRKRLPVNADWVLVQPKLCKHLNNIHVQEIYNCRKTRDSGRTMQTNLHQDTILKNVSSCI